MPQHEFKLMIVDDIEDNRMILGTMLEDDYELCYAASGKECLDAITSAAPDLILLDVTMPDMDGHEVCRRVVNCSDYKDIPVVFVSALVSPAEQLAGFQVGGDDYITKPVCEDELYSKVKASLKTRAENLELQSASKNAMNIAMEAMVSSSELGVLNQFLRDSAVAVSYLNLGEALFTVTQHFGINCCYQFVTPNGANNGRCEDDSLEAKLLTQLVDGDKFVDLGHRTIVTSEHAAILVKNMPIDDDAKYGRIRDHLSVLVDAIETKLVSLKLELNLSRERDEMIGSLIDNNDRQFEDIKTKIGARDESTREIMKQVIYGVEEALFSLGLEDDQEKYLIAMLEAGAHKVEALPDFTPEIEESFGASRAALENLMHKV